MNIQNNGGDTALHLACIHGLEDVVSKLIAKGAKVDAVDANGSSALILACSKRHSKIALQLIETADVNITDKDGNTALQLACLGGLEDVVSKLIEKGAKVDAVDANGNSAPIIACALGHSKIAIQLIDKADVNIQTKMER